MEQITGKVTKVIDGDTFVVNITFKSPLNNYEYNDEERIRANFSTPELSDPGGQKAKANLTKMILNKNVRIQVAARDKFGRVIANKVTLV